MSSNIAVDPEITELWCRVYEAIRQAWNSYGYAPSQAELQRACSCSSTSVHAAFRNLKKNGHITHIKFEARSVKPVDLDRRLYRYEPDPWDVVEETKVWK